MLDKTQRRATKLIPGLKYLRYEERLKECVLIIIILVLPPGVVCSSNRALPMHGTADGDAVSHCQVMGRAGSVHHGADQ